MRVLFLFLLIVVGVTVLPLLLKQAQLLCFDHLICLRVHWLLRKTESCLCTISEELFTYVMFNMHLHVTESCPFMLQSRRTS